MRYAKPAVRGKRGLKWAGLGASLNRGYSLTVNVLPRNEIPGKVPSHNTGPGGFAPGDFPVTLQKNGLKNLPGILGYDYLFSLLHQESHAVPQ